MNPPEIDPGAFDAALRDRGGNVVVLDTRDPAAAATWHVDPMSGTLLNVPEDEVPARVDEIVRLSASGPVFVICTAGNASRRVAGLLRSHGVDAVSVSGGMTAWSLLVQEDPIAVGGGYAVVQFRREARGCLSYLIVSDTEALVVDPMRDTGPYVRAAEHLGVRIVRVFDTHVHADHVSGARELAARTGAILHLSQAALSRGLRYPTEIVPVADGAALTLGTRVVTAISLPGHTTDMIGLLLEEYALVGGDSLFVDSVARPDLEVGDHAARDAARRLHRTLNERILRLPDSTLLLPGHYAGGRHAGAVFERVGRVREAVAELRLPEDPFVDWIVRRLPPKPANFERIIAINLGAEAAAPDSARLEAGANNCAALVPTA